MRTLLSHYVFDMNVIIIVNVQTQTENTHHRGNEINSILLKGYFVCLIK